MSLVDRLRKATLKDEGNPSNVAVSKVSAAATAAMPVSVFSQPFGSVQHPFLAVPVALVNEAEVDPQFLETLSSAMNKVPTPGLQELLVTMDGLAKANVPQNQVCTVALSVVAGKGITLVQVQNELSQRLAALDQDHGELSEMAERQYNIDAGTKVTEITSIDQKLAGLEETKRQLQDRKTQLQGEVTTTRQRIDGKKAGLDAAYAKLKQEAASLQMKVSG